MTIHVIPGEINKFTIAIAVLSGFILLFGYISMFLKEKLFLSEALVAVIVGIIAGPLVSNGFNPTSWDNYDEITKQLTRCIIAIQVMAVGIELPRRYLKKEWLTMLMLLFPVMLFMWLVSGLFIWALIPTVNYLEALVISACICPTDPILANSVVKGRFAEKHVPTHIRNALSAESGANDGMGFPFLFLAIFLISEDSVGTAVGKWIYITWLFQIILSCVIGVIVGYVARRLLYYSEKHHLIDKQSFLAFAVALALFLMSMTGFSGSDDLLACFAAGNAISWDEWFKKETEEAHFQEVIDMMLNLAIFVYIGAIIPWSDFGKAELGLAPWRLIVIAILVLLFRRLPVVVLLKPVMPAMKTYREAVFSGWFGPMGVGAVFLSVIAKEELTNSYDGKELPISVQVISPIVLFIVFCSVIVHGTTIPLFKLGKQIRTRTLSLASLSSISLRFPDQEQQHAVKKPSGDHHKRYHHKEEDHPMTELERNTLYNTLQHDPVNKNITNLDGMKNNNIRGNASSITIDNNLQVSNWDEELFLPDDIAEITNNADNDTDININNQQPTSTTAHNNAARPGSAISYDTQQAIRFLEPVNPRLTAQNAQQLSNYERNEASVSSIRSWLLRQPKESFSQEDIEEENSTHSHRRSIISLFKKLKDHNNTASANTSNLIHDEPPVTAAEDIEEYHTAEHLQSLFREQDREDKEKNHQENYIPRIQIWEEGNQVVLGEAEQNTPEIVIDKEDDPNWKQKVIETKSDMLKKENDK
ncbi:Sodium/hydrogen exchanger family-domain-containing protein [Cokeromyces recurvatus]|uniref:Sodium/hydrogen exchanger family-domain-containing protein n=1 Tax=Cokeromyces recurvatus TaxID=90255 RepID=UPI00221EF834|nr:Sodium/hydrogen exchanger family-domain-containing protein [Cokeromyces recurvatus]KAI7902112.1 Sodium/hydrogen exchanger family-domain-containing protein [Cokeromyces recurvatus]